VEKITIAWPHKKPLVAKVNIPVVKVVNVDVRKNGNVSLIYNIFDLYGNNIHSSFGENGVDLFSEVKFVEKPSWFDFKKQEYDGNRCIDCFSFKSLKEQDNIPEVDYGKIGWATPLNGRALNNMCAFRKERNGSKTMYPVLLYGYIPEGTKYYKVASYNKYYDYVERYISEHVYLLPMNEQTIVTDLTGYWEFLEYVN